MKGSGTQATKQRSKKRILSSRKVFLEQKKIWVQKSFLEKSEAREQAILGYIGAHFFLNSRAKALNTVIALSNVWVLLFLMWWLLKEPFVCKKV